MNAIVRTAVFTAIFLGGSIAHATESGPTEPKGTSPTQLADIKGQYTLVDGRTLTISGSKHKIRAEVDGKPPTVIVPSGNATFTALDHSFTLSFAQHSNGNVSGVTLNEQARTF
jgi:hypothetical protein